MHKYLFFSVLPALLFLSAFVSAPSTGAELQPDQVRLVDALLRDAEPEMRPILRRQLEQSVATMGPVEVEMILLQIEKESQSEQQIAAEEPELQATEEDLAYNRAQYEAFMRKIWSARKAFDAHVETELRERCPGRDEYAVFISAARYELPGLAHRYTTSDSLEPELLFASGYAPQDQRYTFDFSRLRVGFNKQRVSALISKACDDWTVQAVEFKREINELVQANRTELAHDFQRARSNRLADTVVNKLEDDLRNEAPSGNDEVMLVLMSAQPAN
ncbi:MAG: hypothetical protein GYB21_10095 [Oceanospirillales bacterium]|nr:hypothetical protein [Oceanospirillales bacterium]